LRQAPFQCPRFAGQIDLDRWRRLVGHGLAAPVVPEVQAKHGVVVASLLAVAIGEPAKRHAGSQIELRLAAADKAAWQVAADRADLKLSAWIRDRLDNAAKRESS
jgi:hypothetical protein